MAGVLGQFHGFMKLVLAYAALGCVWMILAYATFVSVTMGSGPRGCCGGPTISYSTEGISSFFLESLTQTAITTTTVVIRNATARTPSGNPTRSPIMLVGVSMEGNVEVAVGEKGGRICQSIIVIVLLTRQMIIISVVSLIMSDSHQEQEQAM